ncbi:LOG family protein [Parashewanella spongiae]|uniref:AMP nucleosidase n=1 Tax=Parashewanella spongiae TaxID=342950 RepID=A0A3A6UFF6_9GAMM|nr:nucleotide 5'-monophosphate nucleosidase PpnN [Parashewanella spongiae]MCL1077913.1 nucleotide 5'-monophosphate nucleosidase PpnN [Parashewanella spongiae]RJY17557.1 LOG family protein [Parashewanella spongiae]
MKVSISPRGSMEQLSQLEVSRLQLRVHSELYQLYRRCSLAVLCAGVESDNDLDLFSAHQDFDINVLQRPRGVKLELTNPPAKAFVDDQIISGTQEHLFAVLRDIIYIANKYDTLKNREAKINEHITNMVFDILRNARMLEKLKGPNIIVCWGGHSINQTEYMYTKEVGYQLGLRALDICTGCGPGAMKGPMKGATIGHAKQRIKSARYIGLTEPSIIAAEPPNQIVNELLIMPDIEKRLEAFVRLGHGIIIFAGGAGTAEELLYLLGILLHPDNAENPIPVVLTGPKESAAYFDEIDKFIEQTLGHDAQQKYQIIIDDPQKVARIMSNAMEDVKHYRRTIGDSYKFAWALKIEPEFQLPFIPTHEAVKKLKLSFDMEKADLAANLRRAFSAIVAGNVKGDTIKLIKSQGPFEINGDPKLMALMDTLLSAFVKQQRMKLPGSQYIPCYKVLN